MAAAQHKLSRRALLGAACAAPFLRHPGNTAAAPARTAGFMGSGLRRNDGGGEGRSLAHWNRALSRFRKADAALEAAVHTEDDALYDRLGARHEAALQRLLRTPAPDLPALALKLDLALDDRAVEFVGDLSAIKALKRDARRLARGS